MTDEKGGDQAGKETNVKKPFTTRVCKLKKMPYGRREHMQKDRKKELAIEADVRERVGKNHHTR